MITNDQPDADNKIQSSLVHTLHHDEKDQPDADNKIQSSLQTHQEPVRVYKRRFIVCMAFALNSMANGMIWVTFAPIQASASEYFEQSKALINLFSLIFMISYVPGSILCTYMFKKYGLRKSYLFSSALQVIGCVIRWIGTISSVKSFALVLIGQTLPSISQPFFLNSPARLSAEWFSIQSRDTATGVLCIVNPIGIGIGSIIPTIFVTPDGTEGGGFAAITMIQLIFSAVALVMTALFIQDKPPTPPSVSQQLKKETASAPLKEEIKRILSNIHFIYLLIGYTFGLGLFNALLTLINQYTAAFAYSTDDAGNFSACIMGGGIVGSIIAGAAMDKFKRYRVIIRGFTLSVCLVIILLTTIAMREDNGTAVLILFLLLGFTAVPLLALTFECSAQCTYPVNEELTSGILMSFGCISGVIFTLIWEPQLPNKNGYKNNPSNFSTYFLIILGVLTMTFIFLFDGEYKKLNAEEQLLELKPKNGRTIAPESPDSA
eukprot:128137_1